jgi:hypothetical protein
MRLAALATALLLGHTSASSGDIRPPVTVPLHVFKSGHLGVDVRINGQGPFRLVLDTGSPVTFISTRAAKRLGISSGASQAGGMMGFGMGMNPFASAKSMAVGKAEVKDLSIMVLDHPVIEMIGTVEGPIDGIVGFTFFSRFRTTIDYSKRLATLSPAAYEPRDIIKTVMGILMGKDGARRIVAPAGLWGFTVDDGTEGPVVRSVFDGGPAAEAGLRPGDVISDLNRRWVTSVIGLFEQAGGIKPGAKALITVLRDGQPLALTITPRLGL